MYTYTCGRCDGDGLEMCRVCACDMDSARKCVDCAGTGFLRIPRDLASDLNIIKAYITDKSPDGKDEGKYVEDGRVSIVVSRDGGEFTYEAGFLKEMVKLIS